MTVVVYGAVGKIEELEGWGRFMNEQAVARAQGEERTGSSTWGKERSSNCT